MSWPKRRGGSGGSGSATPTLSTEAAILAAAAGGTAVVGFYYDENGVLWWCPDENTALPFSTGLHHGTITYASMVAIADPLPGMTARVPFADGRSAMYEYGYGPQIAGVSPALGWFPQAGRQTVWSGRDITVAGNVSGILVKQIAFPAGSLIGGPRLDIRTAGAKAGVADTMTLSVQLSTLSVYDAAKEIYNVPWATTSDNCGHTAVIGSRSDTSFARYGSGANASFSSMGATNTAGATAITVASLAATAFNLNLWVISSATADSLVFDAIDVAIAA